MCTDIYFCSAAVSKFQMINKIPKQCHNIAQSLSEQENFLASLIQKCTNMKSIHQIHAHFLKHHSLSHFALSKILAFSALSSFGNIFYAQKVFAQIPNPNIFAYNTLIRGYSLVNNTSKEPIFIYKKLVRLGFPCPNSFTIAFVLKACSILLAFIEGRQIHSHAYKYGLKSSPFVQTGLLTFYAKCEEISHARLLFDEIIEKNLIVWSAMISGYSRIGMVNEAFDLFREMQESGINPDEVTMVSVISACAKAGALDLGKWVHAFIDRKCIKIDLELSTSLIDMYAKCGLIDKAREVFDKMEERDTKAWSSIIIGYAIHGLVKDALFLFSTMMQMKVKANHVTFIGVLSACAHSGLVNEGKEFWSIMQDLGMEPSMEHYGCMIDLLCRAGHFEEAYSFVNKMPIVPNSIIWRTLLVGCRKNKISLNKGEIIASRLIDIEPNNVENYVLLSNLYASYSRWDKVSYMRKKMKDSGLKIVPGLSSIEIDGFVHEFAIGDDSHMEIKEIRKVLSDISTRVRLSGHVPSTNSVLHDVGQEEKENALCEHSERLAIAYGMLKTKSPMAIRVVKNLRVCGDCHEVTKIISKLYGREIIVRDRVRFHRFVGGTCSCNDFW